MHRPATADAERLQGVYINLDASTERRKQIEAELAGCGLTHYRRLDAVDGRRETPPPPLTHGEFGCLMSHVRALETVTDIGLHVLEDDCRLSRHLPAVLDGVVQSPAFARHDIIYTDCLVQPGAAAALAQLYAANRARTGAISFLKAAPLAPTCTASYIVPAPAQAKIRACILAALGDDHVLPVDLILRRAIWNGEITAAVLFPFPTTARLETEVASTIPGRADRASADIHLALTLLRHSFHMGSNPDGLVAAASGLFDPPAPGPDRDLRLIEALMRFIAESEAARPAP